MKKKTLITLIACISVLSFGLTACTGSSSNKKSGDYDSDYEETDVYPVGDDGWENDSDYEETENYPEEDNGWGSDDPYIADENNRRKTIFTDPNDYERCEGASSEEPSSEEAYVSINDFVKNAIGMTFPYFENQTDGHIPALYTFDDSPNRYGFELSNNYNCIYIFHNEGDEPCGDHDICVGASGWFSRLMIFEHEMGEGHLYDLENALKKAYPDCTDIQFVSRSTIPDAPSNISDTLAYWDFTATFNNIEPTKVRLYVEGKYIGDMAGGDDWTLICRPDEY